MLYPAHIYICIYFYSKQTNVYALPSAHGSLSFLHVVALSVTQLFVRILNKKVDCWPLPSVAARPRETKNIRCCQHLLASIIHSN